MLGSRVRNPQRVEAVYDSAARACVRAHRECERAHSSLCERAYMRAYACMTYVRTRARQELKPFMTRPRVHACVRTRARARTRILV